MPDRPLIIIHGWSDSAASFAPLAHFLSRTLNRPIDLISLADYVSMDDEVTFNDLVDALDHAWRAHGLPMTPRSSDVVVHSTGGLIIRDWISRRFAPATAPVHRLLMLAPANFGSPIAHKGRSFIGRVIKGFTSEKMFHVGAKLLEGLELASPYTWNLAMRDRFGADAFYAHGKVLATVLVGNAGFTGIAAAANSDGSDGVVRVSTANLNPTILHANFTNPHLPTHDIQDANGATAFAVLDGENHSSIALKERGGFKSSHTAAMIAGALSVHDDDFTNWCHRLAQYTDTVMAKRADDNAAHGYQNTVFRVHDQYGEPVRDYFLEFYVDDDDRNWFAEMFHRDAIRTVHANGRDTSQRTVLVDCTVLHAQIDKTDEAIKMSLTAMPDIDANGNVGFRTFADQDIDGIRIPRNLVQQVFKSNRTLLVDVTLRREQREHVVQLHAAAQRFPAPTPDRG
jgi:pimeloyl-ACP methyl ester carboxylesterase